MPLTTKELDELKAAVTDKQTLLFKGVLYGEFGMRKTTTALRTSRKRAILLHADRGWQVIHNHPEEFSDNVIPIGYEGLSQIKSILTAVADNVEPFNDIDLIVVDTISQMQENYVDFLMQNAKWSGNFREKTIINTGIKNVPSEEIPGMPDYHLAKIKLRPIVQALVESNVNVIFLAHTREPGPIERAAGKLERRPNITEALYKVIARDATFIGFMDNKKGEFSIDFEPKPTQSCKSQIKSLTDTKIQSADLPKHLWAWADQQ